MKIRISDINVSGLTIRDTIPLEPLNRRMDEGSSNEIHFIEEPKVEMTISGTERSAEASAVIQTRYRQPCSRCLKEVDVDLKTEANFVLRPKSTQITPGDRKSPVSTEDNFCIVYFEGDYADVEEAIQEALILQLSPFLLPDKDSEGNCTICGENHQSRLSAESQTKNTLGSLLKKAGVKNGSAH